MSNQKDISERFKLVYKELTLNGDIKSKRDLATNVGYSPQGVAEIFSGRAKFNLKFLERFCNTYDVSLDFLVFGFEKQRKYPLFIKSSNNQKKEENVYNEDSERNLIPLFELASIPGYENDMYKYVPNKPIYYMDIPDFSGCKAFRAHSSSMEKLIKKDDILFATKEENWKNNIEYGQVYMIFAGYGRYFLKYIRKAKNDKKCFLLQSENPKFDDFDLPKEQITSIWLIHGWQNKMVEVNKL
ncbi:S24 family peptidase [Polaribacter sp. Hel1_85]|uniref:LexA family transcriptional regulator n=1 Tax=Polaribacter sp. Hel1_85 TaxID=1250005 RepID=UPI00052C0313|nr:LexA family transcriptional regulator [Polaribacter sp. Hel1_85]KGL62339.1 peptidase, S24/S26A/S26B/S26C family [Polaribacter sp. Hel1_85]